MSGQGQGHSLGRPRLSAQALRWRLAVLAAAIAGTEDDIADTLERMALTRPQAAARLRERAARAREYATLERRRAVQFSLPP